jgi:hypothetical protein
MTILSIADRIDMAEKAVAEGRIIQGKWSRKDVQGRHLVCALAAFGDGDINNTGDCPADLMPRWLAEIVPTIDDGLALDRIHWFTGELVSRARKWHILDDTAWDRIRTGFMVACIRQALDSAAPVQPDPKPAYWEKVVNACNGVIAALESGEGLQEAAAAAAEARWAAARWAAAEAAAAARWAAAAAAEARWAEARWAAAEAAAAARWAAARWAAAAAAAAARWAAARWAAAAAAAAAYKRLAETLFQLIDAELPA